MLGQNARTQLFPGLANRRVPLTQVNTVVDDVNAGWVDARVAAQDVLSHTIGNSNDSGGSLVSSLFHVGGQAVPAAELLSLPGAQRLQ